MEEIWKDIQGYEGIYEVSNLGRVRSLDRIFEKRGNKGSTYFHKMKGRILKPKLTKLGYYHQALSNGVKYDMSHFRVNRLVAEAFIPNPNNLPEVHHINHIKTDNRVENLMWVTKSDNIKAAIKAGVHHGGFKTGLRHHNSWITEVQINKMFDLEKAGVQRYLIANAIGCSRGTVTNILDGKARTNKNNIGFQVNCKRRPYEFTVISMTNFLNFK